MTLVTWSAAVPAAEAGAAIAARDGVEVEVIDLRTIWPWDVATVVASVSRTGRLLVAHEAVVEAGFGAEVVASVMERLRPGAVRAVRRVGAPRVPVPFAPALEGALRVTAERVSAAALAMAAG